MRCDSCNNEVVVYELYQRSYRLYVYLCKSCKKGFLAHHFDLSLEIYQLKDVGMKENGSLIFITGLKSEPRVFDFQVDKGVDSVIIADADTALGELALGEKILFTTYSERAAKRLRRRMELSADSRDEELSQRTIQSWKAAK